MTDQLDGFFLDFFFSNLYLRKDENQKNRSDSTCKKNLRYDAVRLSESQDLFEKKLYSINYDFPTSKILKKNFNESQNFSENSEPSFVKIIDHNQSISGKIKVLLE